ncbi:transcription antitermination factor NusG [Thermoflavifilum aggregans]|uniref:Transcription antitermination factor NusG n=1 Tax=Thermoflavifilum aggregans TaxID=454188 RepID=A0A2M9CRV2_9BACT|nr:UpxY family transcription antiterminator [Thermoflavifilum aggregans]MBX6381140.1 UpxY family transcription antiterminator [Thermoflavifilum aggregans]PJJ74676.1 transcription antitermination factor NusG [Thermoflavifilum aggregans]
MDANRCWYAVYTRPRWEKKIAAQFQLRHIEHYCPLQKARRQWSDRIKIVEEPLFRSYVFVRICLAHEQTAVRMVPGVINFVYWNGKPAVIRDEEIDTIKRFLREYSSVTAYPLQPGQKVKIIDGVLMDREGLVKKVQGKKVYVILETIGYALVAEFDQSSLEPVVE